MCIRGKVGVARSVWFKANILSLSSTRTDEQLEYSVTRVFEKFGRVYVKIRRDNRGMPYAFAQYEV